jgi:PAT family acetyl-CoA transporter-like MFS transporter 1
VQLASAVLMLLSAGWAEARLNAANIGAITALFFFLVLLAATQDIAVDGWALTLLSRRNIGRALAPRAPARRLALQ